MKQLLFILFGWFLGIFSSVILEKQKRKQIKEDYKDSLITELKSVYPRILATYYEIIREMGQLNKEKLEWMHSMISKGNNKSLNDIDEVIMKLLDSDNEKLILLNKEPQNISSLSFKKFNLSFLQENISSFSLLDKEFRHNVINIRTNINYLNTCIDKIDFFYKTSFTPSLSENNYNIIDKNIKNYYINIADLCKSTSEMIKNIIKNFDGRTR